MSTRKRHVLAFDMGKTDMAWSWSHDNKLIEVGMIHNTVNDLKSGIFLMQVRRFLREVKALIKRAETAHGPITDIVCERFTSRGGKGGGSVGESINTMLGIMAAYCVRNNIYLELVLASTWKMYFKRKYGKDTQAERYGFAITKTSKKWPILDHEFDSVGILQFRIETTSLSSDGFVKQKPYNDYMKNFKSTLDALWKKREVSKNKASAKHKRKR